MRFFPVKNQNAKISSFYGKRLNPFNGLIQFHNALDIAVPIGTEVFSPLSGLVLKTGYSSPLGNYMYTTSGDYKFLFAHLSKIFLKEGDQVNKDKPIALSGKSGNVTGAHLHFGVYFKNQPIDPLSNSVNDNSNSIFFLIPLIILYTILKQK